MKRLFLFLLTMFAFASFACSLFAPIRESESSPPKVTEETVLIEPTDTPLPTETPVPQPAFEATTYHDDEAGFEFDYPVGWAFDPGEQQSRGGYVQFYSWEWNPGDPVEALPTGGSALTVTVLNWDPKNDLEAFVDQRKLGWDSSGASILSEERITLDSERLAAQFIVQGVDGAQAFFLFTTAGDQYLIFSGSGDLGLLADIAHTLRFIQ